MIHDLPIGPALDPVQNISIPIPLDVPLSDVLVTTWSDYTLVCSLVYALGLCMGVFIAEYRRRRILQRQPAEG